MGRALYRTYRSKKLSEIIGQEQIIATLQNALKNDKISHAYLLTGPRGTGKTSVARILAHEINSLPYTDETGHIDIIEIDAASNRRIDEIRDLRDKIHIAPALAKYKVYIIDEVHMLTKEAFNALLKTLEEPPQHAIFILATTEIHKLPETIISRTQRLNFRPIPSSIIAEHLATIAQAEKITISKEALELIAEHGNGSFRDSISLLDRVSNVNENIDTADVREALGIAPEKAITELMELTEKGQPIDLINAYQALLDQGYEPESIAQQLQQKLRHMLINGQSSAEIMVLQNNLINIPSSVNPKTQLELALLQHNFSQITNAHDEPTKSSAKQTVEVPSITEPAKPLEIKRKEKDQIKLSGDAWKDTLQLIKQSNTTLYGVLRMATVVLQSSTLTLTFKFPFHYKKAKEPKTVSLIQKLYQQASGQKISIKVELNEQHKAEVIAKTETDHSTNGQTPTAQPAQLKASPTDVSTISNIFGSVEVLES